MSLAGRLLHVACAPWSSLRLESLVGMGDAFTLV